MRKKKSNLLDKIKKYITAFLLFLLSVLYMPNKGVYALTTGESFKTNAIKMFNNIKLVFLGGVGVVGIIILARGLMELGSSISARDHEGTKSGALQCIGGLITAVAGVAGTYFSW